MSTRELLRSRIFILGCTALVVLSGGCPTGRGHHNSAPAVTSTGPAGGATGVPYNTKVAAFFSEAMDPLTITTGTFFLDQGTTPVSGSVANGSASATFLPSSNLTPNTEYTATITTDATDLDGNALANDHVWTFTTGASVDQAAPGVVSVDPVNAAVGVPVNKSISVTFNEAMDPVTINAATFTLFQGATPIIGSVTFTGLTAIFNPTVNLAPGTVYSATITNGATDLPGNTLASDFNWAFTTGLTTAQDAIDLGSTDSFAVLAGSTVTSTGATVVTGDLGVSPGSAVVGFPPGTLNGSQFTGVASAAGQAKIDLTIAYNHAAGLSTGSISLPGDLSGLTLYPGLYKNSTSVLLSSGNVTLDAQGDANAVFVFRMGSTLTTGSNTQVVLSGGAKATNVYWQVGSSATLGTHSTFKGNILAAASITLTTGTNLEGRALTRIGAVSLGASVVTVPAP